MSIESVLEKLSKIHGNQKRCIRYELCSGDVAIRIQNTKHTYSFCLSYLDINIVPCQADILKLGTLRLRTVDRTGTGRLFTGSVTSTPSSVLVAKGA